MKYLKMFGLAAIAAAALMAFVGSSSASALTLCSTAGTGSETNCGGATQMGKQFTGAIHAELKAGTTAALTGALPVSCTASTVAANVTASSPPAGTINTLTFTGCTVFGFNCSVASIHTPYKLTADSTTIITATNHGNGNPGATITCFGVTCRFETAAAGAELDLEGSDTDPIIKAVNVPLVVSEGPEGTCGSTATWNATYTVTTPTSLWLT